MLEISLPYPEPEYDDLEAVTGAMMASSIRVLRAAKVFDIALVEYLENLRVYDEREALQAEAELEREAQFD